MSRSVPHQNFNTDTNLTDRLNNLTRQQFDTVVAAARQSSLVPGNAPDFDAVSQALQNQDKLTVAVFASISKSAKITGSSESQNYSHNHNLDQQDMSHNTRGGEGSSNQMNLMQNPNQSHYNQYEMPSGYDQQNGMYQQQERISTYDSSENPNQFGMNQQGLGTPTASGSATQDDANSVAKGKGKGRGRKGNSNVDEEADGAEAAVKNARGGKMDEEKRKHQHKEVERRRREAINDGIIKLAEIVPECDSATHKGVIISKAVEYINHLKSSEASNIEKWTLEKLLMDQAMNSVREQLKEAERTIEVLREEREVLMGAGVKVESGGYHSHNGNGSGSGSGNGNANGRRGYDEDQDEESRKRMRNL